MRTSVLILAVSLLLLGCNANQLATARLRADTLAADVAEVNAAVTSAAAQKAEVDALIASLPPGDRRDKAQAVSDKLGKGIAVATEWLDKAEKSLAILKHELATAEDGFDVADAGLKAAGPLIPQPWGAIAAGVGGLVIGLVRAGYNRAVGRRVVKSVNSLVSKTDDEIKYLVDTAQGASGKRLVDEAQGKKFALPV